MSDLYVIIPTLAGRAALYETTCDAWRAQVPQPTIVTVAEADGIGQGWQLGIERIEGIARDADFVCLAADDLVPHAGAAAAGMEAAKLKVNPSPRIMNPDGSLHSCGSLGGGMVIEQDVRLMTRVATSPIPMLDFFTARRMIVPPIHYYADDFVSWMATSAGYDCAVIPDYCFLHMEGVVGREAMVARAAADRMTFIRTYSERMTP